MKKIGISLLCCFLIVLGVLFSYYMTKETTQGGLTVEDVYAAAKEEGYKGTLSEFINEFKGVSGTDGRGISSAHISSTGHLIITYTDGTSSDVGRINTGSVNVFEQISGEALHTAVTSSVSITTEKSDGKYSSGAGVIYKIDREKGDAYIITNYHVVYDNTISTHAPDGNITAYLYGMEYSMYGIELEYVGGALSYDIAVLKVTDNEIIKSSNAQAAKIADSDKVAILDYALAIGNPAGLGISATEGKINVESENRYINTGASGGTMFVRVMRTDAAINRGNSGGGLYNSDGALIGIVFATDSSAEIDNISYAIPSNVAKAVADNIIHYCDGKANENGYILKLGLGLTVKSASVIYDEALQKTVRIEEISIKTVEAESYAEKAGLLIGDTLLSVKLDGRELPITRIHQAPEATIRAIEGSEIVYKVLRDGEVREFRIICPKELTKIP